MHPYQDTPDVRESIRRQSTLRSPVSQSCFLGLCNVFACADKEATETRNDLTDFMRLSL